MLQFQTEKQRDMLEHGDAAGSVSILQFLGSRFDPVLGLLSVIVVIVFVHVYFSSGLSIFLLLPKNIS